MVRNTTAKETVKTVRNFLLKTREIEGDMSVRRLLTLLEVYLHGEIELHKLLQNLDYTSAGATKVVQSWSRLDAYKRPGPHYINIEVWDEDMRYRHITMTPKGTAIVEQIATGTPKEAKA